MNKIRYLILVAATVCGIAVAAQGTITQREGWIDGNYAERQSLDEGMATIDIAALLPGVHMFTLRVCDSEGAWSSPQTRIFIKQRDGGVATAITQCLGWVDGKIDQAQTLNPGQATLDVSGLTIGIHQFTIQAQDSRGIWSPTVTKFLIKPTNSEGAAITHCRYWFDDNEDEAQVCVLQSNRANGQTGIVEIDVSDLEEGEHTLSWMMGNSNGAWSQVTTETFTIEAIIPTSIDTINADTAGSEKVWYNLAGQKQDKQPTEPGIYICNGRKIIVR